MSRKSRIATVLALVGLLSVFTPIVAFAGSPLLSGYGGPGAGEQAIVGSTLLGGSTGAGGAGGGGSSGSLGTGGSSGPGGALRSSEQGPAGQGGVGGAIAPGGSTSTGAGAERPGSATGSRSGQLRAEGRIVTHSPRAATSAFVYPSSLRSSSAGSPALGISGDDLLVLLAMIATLALVGALTVRVSRLQR